MTTRSGKIYTPYHNRCYKYQCEFYGCKRFKYFCSKCYFTNNPNEYKLKDGERRYYSFVT